MLYTLRLTAEAYHKPTATWHVHKATQGVRAVSRKQALDKGLAVVQGWPSYADRAGHADWSVEASAAFAEVL